MTVLRKLLIIPPVLAGVAVVYLAISNREPPALVTPAERRIPAHYIVAEPQAYAPRVIGYGSVEPARTWEAVAQVRGRVVYVHPEFVRGGRIGAGEVLVRIAPDDYELAIAQAEANIRSAAAQIEEMKLSAATTERLLEIERRSLALAERALARQADLAARGAAAAEAAEGQERAVLAQKAKVQDLENTLALFPSRLRALEQSQAVSAAAEIDVQVAPQRMSSLVRLLSLEGETRRGPSDARTPLRLQARVRIELFGMQAEWDAEVKRISDTVDPETRSIGIIVSVPDPYDQARLSGRPPLIKGMFVEVELRGPEIPGLLLVPRAAIRDGRLMLIDADDRLAFADVDTAFTMADLAILRGDALPVGARVVVSEPAPALQGLLLAPVRDDATAARLAAAAVHGGAAE